MSNFKYYRTRKGLSQRQVGEYLGITGQAYSNYETAKRQADYDTLLRLSELFGASIEELISDKGKPGDQQELDEVLEYYRTKPGMKLLFSITKDASPDDIIKAAEMIEELKQKGRAPKE